MEGERELRIREREGGREKDRERNIDKHRCKRYSSNDYDGLGSRCAEKSPKQLSAIQ